MPQYSQIRYLLFQLSADSMGYLCKNKGEGVRNLFTITVKLLHFQGCGQLFELPAASSCSQEAPPLLKGSLRMQCDQEEKASLYILGPTLKNGGASEDQEKAVDNCKDLDLLTIQSTL